jgi:hypothetical protein
VHFLNKLLQLFRISPLQLAHKKKSRRLYARGSKFSSWCRIVRLHEGTRKPATGFAIAKEEPKIKIGFDMSWVGKDCVHGISDSFTSLLNSMLKHRDERRFLSIRNLKNVGYKSKVVCNCLELHDIKLPK